MTHPLDLTVEEVMGSYMRSAGEAGKDSLPMWEAFTCKLNTLYESKRLAERGNSPGIGGLPNNHSNYDRDSKVGD